MTQATDYTKLTLSDKEHTSNGELEQVTFVMEDKETECKEHKSKWTGKCRRFAMDTKKQFLNKVQNLNRRKTAGIAAVTVLATVLGIFVMSTVSSNEMHASLDEKIELVNTTQEGKNEALRLEIEALREHQKQSDAKYELMVSMVTELKQQQNATVVNLTMHIDKSIDSLDQKVTEIHKNTQVKVSQLSTKSKQMEMTLTTVEDKIQKQTDAKFKLLRNEIKQQQNSTVVNLTMYIDKSIDSLDQKVTEIHNNTRVEVSQLSIKSKQMELTLTTVEDKVQSLTTAFKELEAKTRENGDLLQELKTQVDSDAARLEDIIKRVEELKSEKSVTDKEIRKNIKDLSKKVDRTEQNTKDLYNRVEKLNKQSQNAATSIDSQNSEIRAIKAKIESQRKRFDYHDNSITQIEGKQVSLTEKTNAHDSELNRLLERARSTGSRATGNMTLLIMLCIIYLLCVGLFF